MKYSRSTKTLTIDTANTTDITTAIRGLEAQDMPVETLAMDYQTFDALVPVPKGYTTTRDSGIYLMFGRPRNVQVGKRELPKGLVEVIK